MNETATKPDGLPVDIDAAAEEYVAEYVMSTEGNDYEPTEWERELIGDALAGFISEHWTPTPAIPATSTGSSGEVERFADYTMVDELRRRGWHVRPALNEHRKPHPRGFYSPPLEYYAGEVEAFEASSPYITHEKRRKADGSLEDWGRVSYEASHVDAKFAGWVLGRYAAGVPGRAALAASSTSGLTDGGERQCLTPGFHYITRVDARGFLDISVIVGKDGVDLKPTEVDAERIQNAIHDALEPIVAALAQPDAVTSGMPDRGIS